MKRYIIRILISVVLFCGNGSIHAQDHSEKSGHSHASAEIHGGSVTMTKYQHFETVFFEDEIRVYVYSGGQKPINELGEKVSGNVELSWKGGKRFTIPLRYIPPDSKSQHTQGYLSGSYDFSDMKGNKVKAKVSIDGLSNKKESQVSFLQTVKLTADRAMNKHNEEKHEHREHKHEHKHNDHD